MAAQRAAILSVPPENERYLGLDWELHPEIQHPPGLAALLSPRAL